MPSKRNMKNKWISVEDDTPAPMRMVHLWRKPWAHAVMGYWYYDPKEGYFPAYGSQLEPDEAITHWRDCDAYTHRS